MPVDTSKGIALNVSRRHFLRKVSTEEDMERKRARGEISCAECRRLKLKCDKKLPCGSCVRRGCPTICPNGSPNVGIRFVLADTDHLHHKIAEMGHRIHSLEDALAIFQAGVSSDVHPLLTEELLAIKYGLESPTREASRDHQTVPVNGSGTLTITERGDSQYFGRTAGSEAGAELDGSGPELSSVPIDDLPQISSEISRLASILPFNIAGISDENKQTALFHALLDLLPEYPRATTLCETYLENSAWVFRPITREELIDELLAPVYALAQDRNKEVLEDKARNEISPHALAVLYMVFAHGALTDLTLPPYNAEAENYFHLGRLALSLHPVFELPTTRTLQALCLMAIYYGNHGRHPTLDSAWSIMAVANKLAQSIGLHRDPARFNMNPKAIQRRRSLFWELLTADMFHSMTLGRPPSISLSYVDCEFPEDDTTTINDKGEVEMGCKAFCVFHWKYSFAKDVFIPVVELTLTATPPTYATILELDRKVREKVLPPSLNLYRSSSIDEYTTPTSYVRGRMLFQFRTTSMISNLGLDSLYSTHALAMLYIHRSFFVQAMLDYPSNPLRSPFAPSFLAAYRCASVIIKTSAMNFQKYPDLFSRFWYALESSTVRCRSVRSFAISPELMSYGQIIVGTIATRAPSSTMAPAAQLELDLALNLFRSGAVVSPRAKSGLAVLMHLKAKARQAQGQLPVNRAGSLSTCPTTLLPETGVDELAVFGGQTQILVSRILSQQSRRKAQGSSPSISVSAASSPSTTPEESHTPSDPVPEVHPSLVEYLSMLPPPTVPSPPAIGACSVSTQLNFDQKFAFQSDMFTHGLPAMTSGLSSQQTFGSTSSPSAFDEQFMRDFADADLFGSSSSAEAIAHRFDNIELFMTSESGIDERWLVLMQDVLNPPIS
ncbi:fungal-specific transcription factor domain-containing protein [Boletus reticuloceps]|uniref:Fungal-specific transcription factor domain-containing protein n=1 Tax=Boletus reticuloceps TaxID=495285 RepID=A0A8I2YTB2_9AGAM|nr:fungal-specific transcription factor domain-containing protein [Boletus reticuloceps]